MAARHLPEIQDRCHDDGFFGAAVLGYRVKQDTPFVFNIQAERFSGQAIISEDLQVDPPLPLEHWTMPESGNRYFRLIAPPGGFKVSYEATVRLTHPTEDPNEVHEVPRPSCR